MIGKKKAREIALKGEISIGDLRKMIEAARGRGGMSRVNTAFPLEETLDIFDAAIRERPDDEVPRVWKPDPYSPTGRVKPTSDVLLITNILRDAG